MEITLTNQEKKAFAYLDLKPKEEIENFIKRTVKNAKHQYRENHIDEITFK